MKTLALGITASLFALHGATQSTFTPARPPAVPLAVRSPYLSIWLPVGSDGGDGGYLAGETTTFWEYVHHTYSASSLLT